MKTEEFNLEFDILYDNIASKGAPGLNLYEKSVFLTQAQEEIVKNYYSGFNQTAQSFEKTENRRVELKNIVRGYATTTLVNPVSIDALDVGDLISPDSKLFRIPNDVWYIINEQAEIDSTEICENGENRVTVKPITHDEYSNDIKNPFRKPNKRKVLRLSINKINNNNVVELISKNEITKYILRYLKKPLPIILTNFENDPELQGLNLTIDGRNIKTECELETEVHRDILNRAVELAVRTYRENNLQTNIQTNNRVV